MMTIFSDWMRESTALNRCYIETRYPTDIPVELGDKQVRAFMRMAGEMYIFICEQVDEELDRRSEPLNEQKFKLKRAKQK